MLYKDPTQSVDARVPDLVSRMTVEEKCHQLRQVLGFQAWRREGGAVGLTEAFVKDVTAGLGAVYGLVRADPWTKLDLETGLKPAEGAAAANLVQRVATTQTRLGIPLLLAEEYTHGVMAIGSALSPAPIALASTWNPDLARRLAAAVGRELRVLGAHVGYGPVLDLARDPRWSRVEETFGEDPCLVGRMGKASVEGFQGQARRQTTAAVAPETKARKHGTQPRTVCTLKHFAAYGDSVGGHNGWPVNVGQRELHGVLLRAFREAVAAGAESLMASYNEIDGVPCAFDRRLLTDVLRGQWGFEGFVVSDLYGIDGWTFGRGAADVVEAAARALHAGVDMDLGGVAYAAPLMEALRRGLVSVETIDTAVARVLRTKFRLGLFEDPYVKPENAAEIAGCAEHREIAIEIARQGIVLLKNDGVLPLHCGDPLGHAHSNSAERQATSSQQGIRSIAVIGPNADNVYNQLGDYTPPQGSGAVTTVLAGLRAAMPEAGVTYARGCGVRDRSTAGFAQAVAAAQAAELVVLVLGGSSSRYTGVGFTQTAASDPTKSTEQSDMDCGEGFDRHELVLSGVQEQLLEAVLAVGKPVVLVLINGRPVTLPQAADRCAAILEAWYPGPGGGQAIAEVLTGKVNPSGKLPVSIPRHVGQLPVHSTVRAYGRGMYVDLGPTPAYPLGFGLSYTTFEYSNLVCSPSNSAERQATSSAQGKGGVRVSVSVHVKNTGFRAGDEVVQLYVTDEFASVILPPKMLKGFQRITLQPGQSQTVEFTLEPSDLAVLDADMNWTVEPGKFKVMVGGLEAKFTVGKE